MDMVLRMIYRIPVISSSKRANNETLLYYLIHDSSFSEPVLWQRKIKTNSNFFPQISID